MTELIVIASEIKLSEAISAFFEQSQRLLSPQCHNNYWERWKILYCHFERSEKSQRLPRRFTLRNDRKRFRTSRNNEIRLWSRL